jgi:hypothetical protein
MLSLTETPVLADIHPGFSKLIISVGLSFGAGSDHP